MQYAHNQMEEEGLVRQVLGNVARVETLQKEACAHCAAKGACQTLGSEKSRIVTAVNDAGAREGDKVMLSAPRSTVLSAGFLVYIVPVFALLLGAAYGKHLAASHGWDQQGVAVLLGVASLSVCWLILRWVSARLGKRESFKIRVTRILRKGEADAVDQCSSGL